MVEHSHIRRPLFRRNRRFSRKFNNFLSDMETKYDGQQTTLSVTTVDGNFTCSTTASGLYAGPVTTSGVSPIGMKSGTFWLKSVTSGTDDIAVIYQTSRDLAREESATSFASWDLSPDVSAVASGTDSFTLTDHGMVTGDGPFQMSTSGALPAGVAVSTDYWVARVDDDTFQVATTKAGAVASGVVDLTDNGSGTQTIDRDLYIMKDLSAEGIRNYMGQNPNITSDSLVKGDISDTDSIF